MYRHLITTTYSAHHRLLVWHHMNDGWPFTRFERPSWSTIASRQKPTNGFGFSAGFSTGVSSIEVPLASAMMPPKMFCWCLGPRQFFACRSQLRPLFENSSINMFQPTTQKDSKTVRIYLYTRIRLFTFIILPHSGPICEGRTSSANYQYWPFTWWPFTWTWPYGKSINVYLMIFVAARTYGRSGVVYYQRSPSQSWGFQQARIHCRHWRPCGFGQNW